MKYSFKLVFTLLLTFSFISNSFSQIEDYYHSCTINASVPIIMHWQKTIHKKDSDGKVFNTITKEEPQKEGYPQINLRIEDLKVTGRSFSGMEITNYPVADEQKSFYGQVSADKKKIDFIEVTYNKTKYSMPDRSKAHLEETIEIKFRFEDIPQGLGGFVYKKGVTKIKDVSYSKWRHLRYRGQNETYEENFISVDENRITKWTSCVRVNFKPGKTNIEEDYNDKLTVITDDESYKTHFVKGVLAFLMADFSKVPGLKVLERMNYDKIKQELELSELGLVAPETKLESGKILEPDIEVIVTLEGENVGDIKYIVRTTIKDVSTGKIADPGFVFELKQMPDFQTKFDNYIDEIVEYNKRHILF